MVTSSTGPVCPKRSASLTACGEPGARVGGGVDVESASGKESSEELGADLGGQPHPVFAGEHPVLGQDDRRRTVGRWDEADGGAVGGHRGVLVLQQRLPAVASPYGHRPVGMDFEFAAALEE